MHKSSKADGLMEFDLDGDVRLVDPFMANEGFQEARAALPPDATERQCKQAMIAAAAAVFGQMEADWSFARSLAFWRAVWAEIDSAKKAEPESGPPA